jgi:hypothetical protein
MSDVDRDIVPGQSLAIAAEGLYLANLMLAPGIAFAVLAWLWYRWRHHAPRLAGSHLRQTFFVSLWGGTLLLAACIGIILAFGLDSEWTWTYVVIYFTCVHSTLILFGVVGLAKAMSGQTWRYPLIGPRDGDRHG